MPAVLTAETTERKYKSPTADEIYDEVYCEPEDAYFDKATNRFVEHKDGYDFDKKQATEILKNAKPDSEYKIPLKVVHPKKTTAALESEMFSDLLGSYTTNYNASNTNRSHNVALAASKFNGYVMMPGAVFSYNGVVGDRTVAAGYKNAAQSRKQSPKQVRKQSRPRTAIQTAVTLRRPAQRTHRSSLPTAVRAVICPAGRNKGIFKGITVPGRIIARFKNCKKQEAYA